MNEPKLRFKADDGSEFPDWEEKKLGDVCDPLTYGMNAAAVKFDGKNKYIRITDIDDKSHRYLADEFVSPGGELDDKYLVSENDILLARTGASVGKSYIYDKKDGKLYYAGFLIKAHVKSGIGKIIFYQTLTDRYNKWVKVMSVRSGQPGINANEYSDFMVFVPSLPEQQKIAEFLSTIDTVIAKQKETVSAWEERKKGVMQKLFSQEVRFKTDDGSDFPEWKEKKLGEVADIYDGVHQTPEYVSSGVKFVSVENIESIYSTNKYITQKAFERDYKNNIPKKWDILMTRIGDVGRVALIDDDEQLAYYVSLALIRVSSDFVPQFFVQALRSDFFQAELWRNMLHTAYPKKINKQDIGKCKVKFPVSIAEQQKIADCLSALDEVIEKQKATLAVWEELKKGLLQQMFV